MGGGVMRAAAKMAGAGAGALRGFGSDYHPLSSAARRAASVLPATATLEEVKLVASNPDVCGTNTYSETDDWVFAGEEEFLVRDAEPLPRVVFGGVPSLQEAEEATSELSAAFDRAYLSSSSGDNDSTVERDVSGLLLSSTQVLESPLPAPAIMAFRFLSEAPMAKNVVSSIASDPNVWNAVLQNPEFQGFLQAQRTCLSTPPVQTVVISETLEDNEYKTSSNDDDDFFQKIKNAFVDTMNKFSDYLKNLFGGTASDKPSPDAFANPAFLEVMLGLAVLVISVIFVKRAG